MTRKLFALTLMFGAFAALPAHAGTFEHRQEHQRARIAHGVRSGELTRPEASRLEHEQLRLERKQRRAWRDDQLGPREAIRLDRAHDRASRDIRRLKHNRRER